MAELSSFHPETALFPYENFTVSMHSYRMDTILVKKGSYVLPFLFLQ
jgi:hypothetical protein